MEVTWAGKTGKLLLLQTVSKAKPALQISIVITAITDLGNSQHYGCGHRQPQGNQEHYSL